MLKATNYACISTSSSLIDIDQDARVSTPGHFFDLGRAIRTLWFPTKIAFTSDEVESILLSTLGVLELWDQDSHERFESTACSVHEMPSTVWFSCRAEALHVHPPSHVCFRMVGINNKEIRFSAFETMPLPLLLVLQIHLHLCCHSPGLGKVMTYMHKPHYTIYD